MRYLFITLLAVLALVCFFPWLAGLPLELHAPRLSMWLRTPLYLTWGTILVQWELAALERATSRMAWAALRVDLLPTEENYTRMEACREKLVARRQSIIEILVMHRPEMVHPSLMQEWEETRSSPRGGGE